ncbi:MAG TPA: SpoIIE family protein phosphatase [Candidatus Ozemobacteraceae bacterium]|nr:SpoIIE family protein phosphatase [Candidatus Ozemobacteraceae bacterium]
MSSNSQLATLFGNPFVTSLLQSLGEGLVIADPNGNIVFLNHQAEQILCVALETIRGKSMAHCHRCPWRIDEILGKFNSDSPYRAEVPVKDRWLSVTATPLKDAAGKLAGSVMVARDTTERHRLENALKQSNAELSERQERLDLQIELARSIQKALMPGDSVSFPGARIQLWNVQSQIVGGDVLFVHEEDEGGWLLLGDIMGKGLFASQFVPLIHGYIHDEIGKAASPADLMMCLDRRLAAFIDDRFTLFITMICLRWKKRERMLQIACAGHENPYLIDSDGNVSKILMQYPPLGLGKDGIYQNEEMTLSPGARLICYSDGVKDVHKSDVAANPEWLEAKIQECIASRKDPFVELVEYLNMLAGRAVPHDDQSLVLLEV